MFTQIVLDAAAIMQIVLKTFANKGYMQSNIGLKLHRFLSVPKWNNMTREHRHSTGVFQTFDFFYIHLFIQVLILAYNL